MSDVPLGRLIEDQAHRDAIHVAIFPAVANERLHPGQHVGLVVPGNTERVGHSAKPLGIIDPFLTHAVPEGEKCFVCLYPNTVTGMRHHWKHPAFATIAEPVSPDESRQFIQDIADELKEDYETVILAAKAYVERGSHFVLGHEGATDVGHERWVQFWRHFERVTGIVNDEEYSPFSCAC